MGSVNRKGPSGSAVPGSMKISGVKAAQALPQRSRKSRKREKLTKEIRKREDIRPLLARWGESDPTLTSAELERLHRVLTAIERTRKQKSKDDILGKIERSEILLFDKRITELKEQLTVPELKRFRQVVCWQLTGEDLDYFLAGIDRMLKEAEKR